MRRRPVCAIEDLPPGSMRLVEAGKFGVGVYNIAGALYAIANYCSHEGAPLCAGYVGGTNEFAAPSRTELYRKEGETTMLFEEGGPDTAGQQRPPEP